VFGTWTWTRPAKIVGETLGGRGATGASIAVIDAPPLARLLAEGGRQVVPVARTDRPLRRWRGAAMRATLAALPLADGALDAAIAAGGDGEALRELARVVRDGGLVVLVDTADAEETARRILCAGLRDPEQRDAGRFVITSGVVRRLP
jgi:SAM-dependent methyltransferase